MDVLVSPSLKTEAQVCQQLGIMSCPRGEKACRFYYRETRNEEIKCAPSNADARENDLVMVASSNT